MVTASRADLLGKAQTASQGVVTRKEIELRPVFRTGQLFEAVPGLVVTVHSGEGKANQYLIRGYNLDHGTDFANFVDDMPVNRPTNTHGQGYSDLNFLMPQTAAGIDYTKGPYYAAVGDFGSVASSHVGLADRMPDQVSASAGTLGDQTLFLGGTLNPRGDERLMGAVELGHFDGPSRPPQNFRKVNVLLRFSRGEPADGFSLTGMYYQGRGRLTTDQPLRAITGGLIGRYDALDPTDASRSERYSLSAHAARPGLGGQWAASLYAIHSTMTLWNNFTHFLDDPVDGDQEQQDETRNTFGGAVRYALHARMGGVENDAIAGLQARYDSVYVDRRHTLNKSIVLGYCELEQASGPAMPFPAVGGACAADRVRLLDLGPYIEDTTRWSGWLRTVVGAREEVYRASDTSLTTGGSGSGVQTLFQPKGSLIFGPWLRTEVYLSAGRGFHSDDVRGVFGTVSSTGVGAAAGRTPLLASTVGEEIGLRSDLVAKVKLQLSLFQQDFVSELRYNADVGQDQASAPSRRRGVEVSGEYRPFPWIEVNTDLAFSKARYKSGDLAAFGLPGPYIANAPGFIGSFGMLVDGLGPWFGGLQWRVLGPYPINDGQDDPRDHGYSEVNLDFGHRSDSGLRIQVGVYNLFDSRRDAAAYYYAARLPGEAIGGVNDFQVHPLEPRSARLTVIRTF